MKTYILAFFLCTSLLSCDVISKLPNYGGTIPGIVTESEASEAMRQALDQGVGRGISLLNKQDGFYGNQFYKLLLPPGAEKIENTLRQIGMSGMVDKAILQINRSAEDAVGYARPIFVDAIREMTITDAINIIKGPKDAATQYFRQKTTDRLIAAFTPTIKSSLEKFSATKYYGDIVNTYNGFPTTLNKINPDLTSLMERLI